MGATRRKCSGIVIVGVVRIKVGGATEMGMTEGSSKGVDNSGGVGGRVFLKNKKDLVSNIIRLPILEVTTRNFCHNHPLGIQSYIVS